MTGYTEGDYDRMAQADSDRTQEPMSDREDVKALGRDTGAVGARPPVAAIGEVLAYTIRETSDGVYECQLCDADVSQQPFTHEESCEGEVVRRWLEAQGSGGAVGEREEPLRAAYEWIVREDDERHRPDNACAECVPDGPILVEGFRCEPHKGRAYLGFGSFTRLSVNEGGVAPQAKWDHLDDGTDPEGKAAAEKYVESVEGGVAPVEPQEPR